jgi:hypothetical protein
MDYRQQIMQALVDLQDQTDVQWVGEAALLRRVQQALTGIELEDLLPDIKMLRLHGLIECESKDLSTCFPCRVTPAGRLWL